MKTHGCYQLVFSSSCTVYGNPDVLPITEEHPTGNVTNVYGRTKYFIEEMLKDISAAEKVKIILAIPIHMVTQLCAHHIGNRLQFAALSIWAVQYYVQYSGGSVLYMTV
jgi:UDP-glucose 4-epimerase